MYFHLRYYLAEYSQSLHSPVQDERNAALQIMHRRAIIKGLRAAIKLHPEVIGKIEAQWR